MVERTNVALVNHYATLGKHFTDSASTFTALQNVNPTTRTGNLYSCLLVVDFSIPDRPARSQSLYRLCYRARNILRVHTSIPTVLPGP